MPAVFTIPYAAAKACMSNACTHYVLPPIRHLRGSAWGSPATASAASDERILSSRARHPGDPSNRSDGQKNPERASGRRKWNSEKPARKKNIILIGTEAIGRGRSQCEETVSVPDPDLSDPDLPDSDLSLTLHYWLMRTSSSFHSNHGTLTILQPRISRQRHLAMARPRTVCGEERE